MWIADNFSILDAIITEEGGTRTESFLFPPSFYILLARHLYSTPEEEYYWKYESEDMPRYKYTIAKIQKYQITDIQKYTFPLLQTHSSWQTILSKRSSWDTKITPPLYLKVHCLWINFEYTQKWQFWVDPYLMSACPRASMVSMSKWLVGSSRIRKLGLCPHSTAKVRITTVHE